MKDVIYSKKDLSHHRGRAVTIREKESDKECNSAIRKSFVYLLHRVDGFPEAVPGPQIRVIKAVDTESQKEVFFLRVKGTVYFKQGRFIHKVDYLHSLTVKLLWKSNVLTKDSVTLA